MKSSDNPYPSILVVEGSAPATPDTGQQRLYIDVADSHLKRKNDAGAVTDLEGAASPSFHGCRIRHSTTQTVANGATTSLLFNTEVYDTDAYHFTSAAALTGTVTKTAASADIVGSGTLFTTELSVGQVISIPGTATEIGVVSVITDNTNLTLYQTMANSASGQTATRRNEFMSIPSGLGGYYAIFAAARWTTVTASKVNRMIPRVSGTIISVATVLTSPTTSTIQDIQVAEQFLLAEGDYLDIQFGNNESSTITISQTSYASPVFAIALIGV
jgi:hypothetical protein